MINLYLKLIYRPVTQVLVSPTISRMFDKQNYTLAICIDLSKTLDTVNHKILLGKHEHNNIRETWKEWFKSYFSSMQHFVSFNKSNLSSLHKLHGVAQGSMFSPLPFSLYINDFVKTCYFFNFLYRGHYDVCVWQFLKRRLREHSHELHKITDWVTCNNLTINVDKILCNL